MDLTVRGWRQVRGVTEAHTLIGHGLLKSSESLGCCVASTSGASRCQEVYAQRPAEVSGPAEV